MTKMGVETGIPCRSSETLVISEGDMFICPWVFVPLGQPEVDNMDVVTSLRDSNEVVVWLDVSVEEAS